MGLERDIQTARDCCVCLGSCRHGGPHTHCPDHKPASAIKTLTVGEVIEVMCEAFDKLGLKIVPK